MFTWGSKGGEKSLKPFGALFEIKGKKTGFKKLPNMGKKEHKTHTHIQARTLSSNYRQRQPLSREDVCNPEFNRGGVAVLICSSRWPQAMGTSGYEL